MVRLRRRQPFLRQHPDPQIRSVCGSAVALRRPGPGPGRCTAAG
jgi:hypothetical protein